MTITYSDPGGITYPVTSSSAGTYYLWVDGFDRNPQQDAEDYIVDCKGITRVDIRKMERNLHRYSWKVKLWNGRKLEVTKQEVEWWVERQRRSRRGG